ncbi:hypothetical protein [Leyella stercorea]|uniref:hypothetical protein n=1 Tax=Leyella stercorea TaxID=363265 RepID=UPI00248C4CA5|nr:hypothetical protein [Leyella stercorea]
MTKSGKSTFNHIKSTPIADIRKNGVLIKSSQRYTSGHLDRDGRYDSDHYYYYYYHPQGNDIFDYDYSLWSWRDCLLLPIKD